MATGALSTRSIRYDSAIGNLRGLPTHRSPSSPPLDTHESRVDVLVHEAHPSSSTKGDREPLCFVLADGRHKDNRIPPRGFRIQDAAVRLIEPVWHGDSAPDWYSAEEYAGGYDAVTIDVPAHAASIEVNLFYQTTSRDYIEFLRDQIRGDAATLPSPSLSGQAIPHVIQTDPFFARLKAWGDTIWALWLHNKDRPGAAPVLMTRGSWP